MNKLEYIPGDLVMTKTEPNDIIPNGVVCKFNEYVFRDKVYVCTVMLADNFICKKEDIAPIPLTPEILEKNGWAKDKEGYINDSYHLHLCGKYDGYSVYKVVNDNVVWLTGVRNVSDLQHLLFGFGINHEMEV